MLEYKIPSFSLDESIVKQDEAVLYKYRLLSHHTKGKEIKENPRKQKLHQV